MRHGIFIRVFWAAFALCLMATSVVFLASCGGGGSTAAEDAAQRAAVAAPAFPADRAGSAARVALAGDRLHPSTAGELAMLDVAAASGSVERVIETGAKQVTAAIRLEHLVITAGDDDLLRVWRPATGALVGEVHTPQPLVFMAEAPGSLLAVAADASGALVLVDISDPHHPELRALPATAGHGPALSLGFSEDSGQILVVRSDGDLERFDTLGGRQRGRLSLVEAVAGLLGSGGRPTAAQFYSEGIGFDEKLLLAEESGAVIRLNLRDMQGTTLVDPGLASGKITSVAKAPYGELAAGTDAGLLTLENAAASPVAEGGPAVTGVAFDSEGQLWVAGAEGVHQQQVGSYETQRDRGRPALGLSLGAGGVVALNQDGAVSLLGSLGDGLALPEGTNSPIVDFAPGGGLVLAAGTDPNHVERLFKIRPGHGKEDGVEVPNPEIGSYEPDSGWWPEVEEGSGLFVNDVAADGEFVAAGGQDPTGEAVVLVWDAHSGHPLKRLPLATGAVTPGEESIVTSLVLAPGKRLLAAYSAVQQSIVIWSTEDWRLVASLPVGPVGDLSLSPDESTILAVGLSEDEEAVAANEASSKLIFIDAATGKIDHEVVTGDVDRAGFSPDGTQIALAGIDGTLRLRSSDGREELRRPIQLDSEPAMLAWRPDGALIAVALKEHGIVLVDPHLGRVSPPLPAESSTAFRLSWSDDGRFLADSPAIPNEETGVYEPGDTQIWTLGAPRLERRMCELSGGPIGRAEWRDLVDRELPYRGLCRRRVSMGSPERKAKEVVLGSKAFELHGSGWGTAEPSEIFNGGDPSGLVTEIHWHGWGGAVATGYGLNSIFKPEGGYYPQPVRIELRASGLDHCGIDPAYTRLQARVPKRPGAPLGPWFLWSGAGTICSTAY